MEKSDNKYKNLVMESQTFDKQIIERIKHGHIPDLRTSKRCNWFYNNPWRDPVYADMLFGEIVRDVIKAVNKYIKKSADSVHILEIACGPGHISLELSRNKYNVIGIDISQKCIEIAQKTSNEDPYYKGRGRLEYRCENILEHDSICKYDVVLFSNALHHFGDLQMVLKKVDLLLKPDGVIFVSEPVREELTDSDAIIIHLIRGLLSIGKKYYEEIRITNTDYEFEESLRKIKDEFDYKDEFGKNVQSPNDNESTFSDMYQALKVFFDELEMGKDFSFFDRIIGGLRFGSVEEEHKVARWLRKIDVKLCKEGIVSAEQFHFIGRKRAI